MTKSCSSGLHRKSIFIGLLVLFGAGVFVAIFVSGEPRYQGRTLTSWLQQYSDAPMMETNQVTEAQNAILAIGPAKSLPILLRLIETKDGPVNTWILDRSEKFRIHFLNWRSEIDCQLCGIAGFEVFGSNAAPAVARLTKLLNDKDRAFMAARALENIGKPAEAALCQCLANQNWQVRHLGVSALAGTTDDVEVYIARIKGSLNDPDAGVRFATIQALGAQENAPDLAVPVLIGALGDREDSVSSQAAEMIGGFGTNAVGAFSALTNLISTGTQARARAAIKALAAVAPSEAVPILSNTVVNGTAPLSGAGLSSLKLVAPDLGLQMTLAELRSTDAQRRSQAVGAAGGYDINTPGIAEALKAASADSDAKVSQHAIMTIRQMVEKQKEAAPTGMQFPDDPSYQGKPLSHWLKMQRYGGNQSTNSLEAIRHMGTNAIPSLLRRVEYKDAVFGVYDFEVGMEGVSGLIALGDQAKPALPKLTELMNTNNDDIALLAMMATLGTGRDAIPCLIQGLTNQFSRVRGEAADYLTGEWSDPYPEERKRATPFLVKLLSDPDPDVRSNVTNELKMLDPQAAAKAGIR